MKNIKLISNWINLDPLWKLTPECDGIWENCNFNPDISQKNFDFVIILNCSPQKTILNVPKNHIWAIMQEPYIMGKQESVL